MTNCYFFPTPDAVVDTIIKNEACGHHNRVLEPAVGDGALLKAIGNRYKELLAYDINQENLIRVSGFVNPERSSLLCQDFLSAENIGFFDLILSNPPFNNKLKYYICYENKKVPIEVAFVLKSLKHLLSGGKAIFILPSSIINGDKSKWLREYIISKYRVVSVYKLPKYSFKNVESGFYVICLENISLSSYNIVFHKSCSLSYNLSSEMVASKDYIFDPDVIVKVSEYMSVLKALGDSDISSLATISRGNICATGLKDYIYHSTDFKSHLAASKNFTSGLLSSAITSKFSILLKRVGRSASMSFSVFYGKEKIPCSDCVIIIKPKTSDEISALSLLLMLRVSTELGADALFEISGSGANYISLARLKMLKIPKHACFLDLNILNEYKKIIISGTRKEAVSFEKNIASYIYKDIEVVNSVSL